MELLMEGDKLSIEKFDRIPPPPYNRLGDFFLQYHGKTITLNLIRH
jgi:hypothetical protein